ncbi:MAG: hypothetical protein SOI13_01565 [Bifidobacterium mongoliense]|jgi:hypothetical protein|uniref:hypothetical protein n=1 Tax=Bifidobacterium mongoliense TaxID=518643 RepID=UPI002F35BBD1
MSLVDEAAAAQKPESEHIGSMVLGPDGGSFDDVKMDHPITDWSEVFKRFHLDPQKFAIADDTVRMSTWQQSRRLANGDRDVVDLYSYRARFRRISDEGKAMAELLASQITPVAPKPDSEFASGDPLVICFADLQTGKAGERFGGTAELIDHFHSVLGSLVDIAARDNPRIIAICDLGDICEGWSNHTSISQVSTNDITQSEQLRVARRLLTEAIISLAPYAARTIVAGVDSNHMQERVQNGQQNRHGDYGLENLRGIKDAFELLETDLEPEFVIPGPLDSGAFITVDGLRIALTHGHDAKRIQNMPQWLANQAAMPGSPYAKASVLVHGHYHHLAIQESRHRLILGCPALESGSNWVLRGEGEESDPGVLTFRVHDGRLHGLRIVEP